MDKIPNCHGDLTLYPIADLTPPNTYAVSAPLHVLQASRVSGNRHEVISASDPIFRWTADGVEYLHCASDYEIRHVGGDCEHGVQKVQAGTRKVLHEEEYDPFLHELRRVID